MKAGAAVVAVADMVEVRVAVVDMTGIRSRLCLLLMMTAILMTMPKPCSWMELPSAVRVVNRLRHHLFCFVCNL